MTSHRSAVGAPQQQQKREQSGRGGRDGRTQEKQGPTSVTTFKIIYFFHEETSPFLFNQKRTRLPHFLRILTLFTSPLSAAGEFFVFFSVNVGAFCTYFFRAITIFSNILQQSIVLKMQTQMEAVLFFVSVIFYRRKC